MRAKLVNESLNENLNLSSEDYSTILKKLEYTFKKSSNPLVTKIVNKEDLTDDDLNLLLKKFEYTYRKSNSELINKIKDHLDLKDTSNIKYSSLAAKKKRDLKNLNKKE